MNRSASRTLNQEGMLAAALGALRSLDVKVVDLDSQECMSVLAQYLREKREVWNEDIAQL